jgi:hypothetical protein
VSFSLDFATRRVEKSQGLPQSFFPLHLASFSDGTHVAVYRIGFDDGGNKEH